MSELLSDSQVEVAQVDEKDQSNAKKIDKKHFQEVTASKIRLKEYALQVAELSNNDKHEWVN